MTSNKFTLLIFMYAACNISKIRIQSRILKMIILLNLTNYWQMHVRIYWFKFISEIIIAGELFCPGSTQQSKLNESKTSCCWKNNFTSCFRYLKCFLFNLKHVKINENHCWDYRHHHHTDGKQNWSIHINQNWTFTQLDFYQLLFGLVILSVINNWTTSIAVFRSGFRIVTVNICWLTEKSLRISLLTLFGYRVTF